LFNFLENRNKFDDKETFNVKKYFTKFDNVYESGIPPSFLSKFLSLDRETFVGSQQSFSIHFFSRNFSRLISCFDQSNKSAKTENFFREMTGYNQQYVLASQMAAQMAQQQQHHQPQVQAPVVQVR